MAYHETKTDYSGRTVDMLLLQTVYHPAAETVVDPNVAMTPHMATGIEKLVQRYALLFLTEAGSVKNDESKGTAFMKDLATGHLYNEETSRAAATLANMHVVSLIKEEDASLETAPDEALESATITDVTIDSLTRTVSVTVRIVSQAGDSYVYTMPVQSGR